MRAVLAVGMVLVAAQAWAQPVEIAPPGGPIDGTKLCTSGGVAIASSPTNVVAAIVCNADTVKTVKIGDATPALTLGPGMCLPFDTANLGLWSCQGDDVTVEWVGTRAK